MIDRIMEKRKIDLVLEQGEGTELWGRVNFNDSLITDYGRDVQEIEAKIKELLHDFEDIDPETIDFQYCYDVYNLFQRFDYLNISKVAARAGINPGLLRQYASQVKNPSLSTAKKIEEAIHQMADEMSKTLVFAGG
jgi:hypothetical protein